MTSTPPPQSPAERSRPDPLLGTELGPYRLERQIGEGGLGRVYLGIQTDIGLRVAIKVLGTEGSQPETSFVERFQKEAQALARVSHPNVVRILGYAAGPPFPYLIMEMVEDAQPLTAFLNPRTSNELAKVLLRQLLFALEAVHAAQVVHRDLKPTNILVQSVPGQEHLLRLVDFGLAKFLEGGRHTRLAGGTPAYMAPEQMGLFPVGPSTDLYAVGVLALELLTGRRLFGRMPEAEILRLKRDSTFRPRSLMPNAQLSPELAQVIDRATAFDPAARFSDAPTMRAALEAATGGGEPVQAEVGRGRRTRVDAPAKAPVRRAGGTRVFGDEPSMPTLDPGLFEPTEPTSGGSRPVMGALETTSPGPREGASERRRPALWAAVAAGGLAALGALVLATTEAQRGAPTAASGATPTLPPHRLLEEERLPAVARTTSPTVIEAVPLPETRPVVPKRVEPTPTVAPAPKVAPIRARPSPSLSSVESTLALNRARSALRRCECVEARAALSGLTPPPGFQAALAACQPPMLGEPCAPGRIP